MPVTATATATAFHHGDTEFHGGPRRLLGGTKAHLRAVVPPSIPPWASVRLPLPGVRAVAVAFRSWLRRPAAVSSVAHLHALGDFDPDRLGRALTRAERALRALADEVD